MGSSNVISVLSVETTRTAARAAQIQESEGLSGRVMDRVRQVFCGLHGHDNMLQFEHEHMFLRCTSCGHQTPGWRLHDIPPARVVRKDASSSTLVRPQLETVRRVA
jgi:hypothetical protein